MPPLVVQECPPLVVMSHLRFVLLMSVTPLEMRQVWSGGLETGFQVALGIRNGLHHFLQILPQGLDVLMPP